MKEDEKLFKEVLSLSKHIRYVAVYKNDKHRVKQRMGINKVSSSESDKYEELLVNPVLIKLATQRGNIDCGGLQYFIIRYGSFFVLLIPSKNGHVNIGIEPEYSPDNLIEPMNALLKKFNLR